MRPLTAEEITGIVTVAVGFTEFIKLSKYVPERFGLLIAMIVSALTQAAYVLSMQELVLARTVIWPVLTSYLIIVTAAAGVYGIVREVRGSDVVDATRTPKPPMWLIAALGGSLIFGSACAKYDPNLSPERNVALYGTQVAGYLKQTKTVVDTLFQTQVLNEAQYKRTLGVLLKANEAGDQLGTALLAYDAATEATGKADAAKQVDAALIALNTFLPQVLSEVTNTEGRAKVGSLIDSVQRLVLTISRATLPRPTALLEPGSFEWNNTPVEAN